MMHHDAIITSSLSVLSQPHRSAGRIPNPRDERCLALHACRGERQDFETLINRQ